MKAKFLGYLRHGSTVRESREGFTIGKVYDVEKSVVRWLVTDDDGEERARPVPDFEPVDGALEHGVVYRIVRDHGTAVAYPDRVMHHYRIGDRVILFKYEDENAKVVRLTDGLDQWIEKEDVAVDDRQTL